MSRPVRFSLLALVVAVQAYAALQRRWMQEDGFINIRVAQQLAAGHGPVFNAGQRVEAFTSPLWIAVLAVGRLATFGQVPYEWIAVFAGICLSIAGTALLLVGAVALWTPPKAHPDLAWWVPVGILVPLALPPFWDFATSGLETSLAWAWIGGSFAALTTGLRTQLRADAGLGDEPRLTWRYVLIGLAPLVRPELVLYGIALGLGLALLVDGRSLRAEEHRRWWVRGLVAWAAIPFAYQVFRMGFYASMLPNTALAKNAGTGVWDRGMDYLDNFASTYKLILPALALMAVAALRPPKRRSQVWAAACVAIPAVLHGFYVIWVGGDYMHGRFWLVPVLALTAPVAAMPFVPAKVAADRMQLVVPVGAALVAIWAMVAASSWRPPLLDQNGTIDDQRALVVTYLGRDHPVRLSDQPAPLLAAGDLLRARAGEDVYLDLPDMLRLQPIEHPREPGAGTAARFDAIGVTGVRAGTEVSFVDAFGLADPVAARTPPVSQVRAGHTHSLSDAWRLARAGVVTDDPGVAAARKAMTCGQLGDLLEGTEEPLTIGRFVGNLFAAPANTSLEVPAEPEAAVAELCGS